MSKGEVAERDLVTWFWERGYAALRAPGSGSIDRPSPDVVAIRAVGSTRIVAIELKAQPEGTATFKSDEISELEGWANLCDATPYVGVKPDMRSHSQWYFLRTSDLHETPEGNHSIRKQDHGRCLPRAEL